MAVYNPPIGNGTLQFNTNDFIIQNDKTLSFLEADNRYSQTTPIVNITGTDPTFTSVVRIGEKSGSASAGLNVVEIGSDETATSGTFPRKVCLGTDAGVDNAREEVVLIGYKSGRVDSGKFDGGGTGGDGRTISVGYSAGTFKTTEGSISLGTFSGANSNGFDSSRTSGTAVGAYAGRSKLGSSAIALGYGSGNGGTASTIYNLAPFCTGLNGTGTLINFGWNGTNRIDNLSPNGRCFITPISSISTAGGPPDNPMCYDTTSKEVTYD